MPNFFNQNYSNGENIKSSKKIRMVSKFSNFENGENGENMNNREYIGDYGNEVMETKYAKRPSNISAGRYYLETIYDNHNLSGTSVISSKFYLININYIVSY